MSVANDYIEQRWPNPGELSTQFVSSIHERFDSALRRFLLNKVPTAADAEDIAQEVYLRFAKLDDPRKILSESAFLFTTATNLLRDRSRRLVTKLERASISTDEVTLKCTRDDPAQRVQDAEEIRLALETLDQIGENSRIAFCMSRIEGKSYTEIAETMCISVSMVEKHISRALAQLRQAID